MRDVAGADDGDVVGDAAACRPEGFHRTDRRGIVGGRRGGPPAKRILPRDHEISAILRGISWFREVAAGMSQGENNNGVKASPKDRRSVIGALSPFESLARY